MSHPTIKKSIFIRNAIIFLIVYFFTMGIMTYITADRAQEKMKGKAVDAINSLSSFMSPTIPEDATNEIPLPIAVIYGRMGWDMRRAADENIYMRAELYNGLNELIAQTGNVLIIDNSKTDENGNVLNVDENTKLLCLDNYMSIDEINSFFKPKELWNLLGVRVTGIDSNNGIIPQKIELFDGTAKNNTAINEKVFSNISDDAEVFGEHMYCNAYFERMTDIGSITKTDQKRYNDCSIIAESSLKQYSENGFYQEKPIEDNIFVVRYANIQITKSWNETDSRYLSIGLEYFPLEVTIFQLLPLYIVALIFLFILMLILSVKLNDVFNKQAELDKSRRDFTNAVAHELKTPLGIIRSYSEGLKEKIDEDKRDYYLDVIIEETEQMDKMVVEMLNLSKLEANAYTLNPESFSLKTVTEKEIERYKKVVEEKQINFKFICNGEFEILADKAGTEYIISNFISNAIKHTPLGMDIIIKIESKDKKTSFSIENQGDKIPQDKLLKIWESFYKVDDSRERKDKGTGLGLAIAKKYLELFAAEYGCRNTESGILFWFIINDNNS